jgi:hypothetical protein
MASYNAELLRKLFKDSLAHLGLSLLQAKDWINSRLIEEGIEYSYHQLYRFSQSGKNKKPSSRQTLDREILFALARIGFWWDNERSVAISSSEIEQRISIPASSPSGSNQRQLSLLELRDNLLRREESDEKGTLCGAIASPVATPDLISQKEYPSCDKLMPTIYGRKSVSDLTDKDFYRLKNWLTRSLNVRGLPGQPRTCAQENGFRGRIGENLNLLLEGDRNISLTREDYIALSFILFKIEGWSQLQPIFDTSFSSYVGDWQRILIDLRRDRNGQPAPL